MKGTTTDQSFLEKLMVSVKEIYQKEAKEILERHQEQMAKELENKMDEIVTRAGLRIEELVRVDSFGSEIRISILKNNLEESN